MIKWGKKLLKLLRSSIEIMTSLIVADCCEMAILQHCSSSGSPCLINIITASAAEWLTGKVQLCVPFPFHGDTKSVQLLIKWPSKYHSKMDCMYSGTYKTRMPMQDLKKCLWAGQFSTPIYRLSMSFLYA